MRKFKIKVIAHSLKNNQIGYSKDIVNQDQLTSSAEELIEAGFIEEVFEDAKVDSDSLDELSQKELIQFAEDNDFLLEKGLKKPEILISLKKQMSEKEK